MNINDINKNEVYLILNSQLDIELIELARTARQKGCVIGKDIGIISYNESPINEIILNGLTVFSTNFKQMGELAAKMAHEIRNPIGSIELFATVLRKKLSFRFLIYNFVSFAMFHLAQISVHSSS